LRFPQGEEKQLSFTKLRLSKKGVGSVIGAVFIVLIILSGFTFYELSLLNMNDYTATTTAMDMVDRDRSNEKLSILSVQITSDNKLNITVKNIGSLQSNVIWLGLFNQSVTPENQGFYSTSEPISIGETQSFLSPFKVTPDQKYTVQLITELGNIFDYALYSASQVKLDLSLIAAPPTVYQSNNITLLLTVTNNNQEGVVAENITVSLTAIPSTLTSVLSAPTSLNIDSLAPGSSKFFSWTYAASELGTVLFEATYNQAAQGTFATASVSILSAPSGGSGGDGAGQVLITGTGSGYASYTPNQWSPQGGTGYVSGTSSSLTVNDLNSAVFSSYFTGTYVNYNYFPASESSTSGTHSNFNALKSGPDGISDTLTETDISGGVTNTTLLDDGFEAGNYNNWAENGVTSWSDGSGVPATGSTYGYPWLPHSGTYMADADPNDDGFLTSNDLDMSSASAIYVRFWFMEDDVDDNDNFLLRYFNGYSYNSIQNLNYLSSVEDTWYEYTAKITDSQYFRSNFRIQIYSGTLDSNEACFIDDVLIIKETTPPPNYELTSEVQWTNLDYTQSNEVLAIYLSGYTGFDYLAVDVWNGAWQNVIPSLSYGWNNVSVSSYLTSSTFTIRFRDSQSFWWWQSSWDIDVALLNVWGGTDQYTAQVEFTGSSTTNSWLSFDSNIASYLDTGSALMTIQYYNYTSGSYMTSGDGYLSYTSSATPYTSQLQSMAIGSNAEDYVDSSGQWKVKITAIKDTATQFNVYFDWIQIDLNYTPSSNTIPYGGWQTYTITSKSGTGYSTPYVYVSIYVTGTDIALLNAANDSAINNPAWVQLDANGVYQIKLQATNSSGQAVTIIASVGTTVGHKAITQEAL
jgi:hypothetical protein